MYEDEINDFKARYSNWLNLNMEQVEHDLQFNTKTSNITDIWNELEKAPEEILKLIDIQL